MGGADEVRAERQMLGTGSGNNDALFFDMRQLGGGRFGAFGCSVHADSSG